MLLNKILRAVFYWPFRLTTTCTPIPYEPLKHIKIDHNRPIVYMTVSSSIGNLMCIERLTQKLGLPSPFSPLYINGKEYKRLCYLRRPGFFSSKGAKTCHISPILNSWFDISEATGKDVQILPITVLWSRNPGYEGKALRGVNSATPSWRKFLMLIFSGRDNCTIIDDPVNALDFKKRVKARNKKHLMHRVIKLSFLKKARSIIGKPLPNRQMVIDALIKRPAILNAINEECKRTGLSTQDLEKKARSIYNVMVADTRYSLLKFLNSIITLVWKRIYHGQTILGAERVRKLVQTGHEIIYIPCHRSHMDYILLSFVIFHEGLPIPQVASGDNLNFFPVGQLIKRCGSYFIRRKMKGDTFYIALFNEYLSLLFERGYATEFFIEGGRSRTGRTLPPKTGMVAMTIQAQLRGLERPIAFIPTYLGYEHVSEVSSYMRELNGQSKAKESAKQLLGIFKRFRYYGRGYVTFGKPVVVTRFLNANVPNWRNDIDPTGLKRPDWLHETVNQLSRRLIINLNDAATINGINLCALAIMNVPDHAMSTGQLRKCLNLYIKLLKVDKDRRKSLPTSPADVLIQQALELNKFRVYDVGDDMKFVRPSHGQSLQLTYFQNNIVHLFALPALLANIILRNGHILHEDVRSHARSLFYFLRHELFAPVEECELDYLIDKYLETFLKEGYITRTDNMIYVSGDGYTEFFILSRCIYHNLIRYLVAETALKNTKDGTIDVQTFVDNCLNYAKRLPLEVTNNSPEFADPILFKIMCDTLIRHQYFKLNDEKKIVVNRIKLLKLANACEPLLGARDVRILNGNQIIKPSLKESKEN